MTSRLSTGERRQQVVLATLQLLTELPAYQITTRAIATAVGISQPALFRHFRGREEIFTAVLEHTRAELREGAEAALIGSGSWDDRARAFSQVFAQHINANPGLPRLFFHELATPSRSIRPTLSGLVDMQAGLVAQLVEEAKRARDLPQGLDSQAAGRLFTVAIQGAIALSVGAGENRIGSAVEMWIASVKAGVPQGGGGIAPTRTKGLLRLDARPLIAAGEEPLPEILRALTSLRADGFLRLLTPFRPGPLLRLLGERGHTVTTCADGEDWITSVCGPDCPVLLDLRDREAPEPLETVLLATAAQSVVLAQLPRLPRLLFPHLQRRGLHFEVLECEDGSALLYIRKGK